VKPEDCLRMVIVFPRNGYGAVELSNKIIKKINHLCVNQ
jgi:hypothetical protein